LNVWRSKRPESGPKPAQPLERRHHITEHLSDAERFPAARFGDRIVQVEDVDPVEA
jgi:hypothetical protein